MTPGMEEPSTYIYTVTDKGLSGYHSMNPQDRKDISFIDSIGYTCVSPEGQAQMKTHHEVLHKELNERSSNNKSLGR